MNPNDNNGPAKGRNQLVNLVLSGNPIASFIIAVIVIAGGVYMLITMHGKGFYTALAVFMIVGGIYLIINFFVSTANRRKEAARLEEIVRSGKNTKPLRRAEKSSSARVHAQASFGGYRICYRRLRSVNELVINDRVYDEKRGVFEFAHSLCAYLDGHLIEVGYDIYNYSFIKLDGNTLEYKRRLY